MSKNENIELDNGRFVSLTEGGWEVHPWRSDKTEWYFDTLGEALVWGMNHNQWGERRSRAKGDDDND